MIVPVSVTALAIFATFSRNALGDDGDFRLENDILMSSSNMKDVKKLLKYEDNLEYFKPRNENITVIKNQIHGECILNLNVNNVTEVLNLKNKFYTREELSEDEMNGIFGKDILDFCNDLKIIIALKNFDDYHFFTENRSKRSTNEKRNQGQTKTQFEIFASKNSNQDSKNGLAEASSQPDLSRATVSGLNGMGQAQGQSSSNDCDECHGREYQVYQRPEDNSQPGYIPNVYRQNYNHVGSNTNSQLSGLQDEGSDQGSRQEPSINEQYPNKYPNLETKNRLPNKQDRRYGSSFDGQYPSSYPGLETNNRVSDKQDHRYNIGTFFDKQYPDIYPSLAINNKMPHKQDQEFNTGTFIRQNPPTHPSLESNYESFIRNLPSLCNFLICFNSLTCNNKFNQFQIIPNLQNVAPLSQNNERNLNGENQFENTKITRDQNFGFPLHGDKIRPNQMDQTYRGSSGSGESGYQHPSYVPSSKNINLNQIHHINQQSLGALSTRGYNVQQHSYTPSNENMNPSQLHFSHGKHQGSSTAERHNSQHLSYSSYGRKVNSNQIQPTYWQHQNALNTGRSNVQQRLISTREPSFQQPSYASSGESIYPNQAQSIYNWDRNYFGVGRSNTQQLSYIPYNANINPNQMQPSYEQSLGSFGNRISNVVQPSYISSGNIRPNQIQLTNPQSQQGPSGIEESNTQNFSYAQTDGNINKLQTTYGQYQSLSSTGESNAQLTSYTPFDRDVFQNGPSFQLTSDMKKVPGNYPSMYTDNYYNGGQQFKLGSQVGNKHSSPNPIVGGQYGSDLSTGSSITPIDTEGGDAQSMTNINIDGKETSALASSQGKSKSGMTLTQVSGSYSTQAQTSVTDKGTFSQIESNTNGTISTPQGKSGKGQTQSQIGNNSESGVTQGEAQSSGINYVRITQLQAGIKGVADVQSTGPGSTSSKAQIGFLPYESNINTEQKPLFKGSGAATSQSGSHSSQTQSQLFGSYKHGISYNGVAQASLGKKLQHLPQLNVADAKLKIGQLEESDIAAKQKFNTLPPQLSITDSLRSQTSSKNIIIESKEQNITKTTTTTHVPIILSQEPSQNFDIDSEYEDIEEYEEYNDESDDNPNTKSAETKTEPLKQEQNIILNLDDQHDAQITHDSDGGLKHGQVFGVGQIIPGTNGTKVSDGFRGKVAGDHIKAKAVSGGQAQTQTTLLTPGTGGSTMVDKTKVRELLDQESYVRPIGRSLNSLQTDLNGETGKYKSDGIKNVPYFTKSSTCGYFSFSCNFVNGAKSGPKICKPNPPPFPCQKNN